MNKSIYNEWLQCIVNLITWAFLFRYLEDEDYEKTKRPAQKSTLKSAPKGIVLTAK